MKLQKLNLVRLSKFKFACAYKERLHAPMAKRQSNCAKLFRCLSAMPPLPLKHIPRKEQAPYCVLAQRAWSFDFEYYRIPLRERLPKIPIPLRQTDRDVVLDLQAVFDQAYVNGRYDDTDYTVAPDPPLLNADAVWADAWLREKGRRPATT